MFILILSFILGSIIGFFETHYFIEMTFHRAVVIALFGATMTYGAFVTIRLIDCFTPKLAVFLTKIDKFCHLPTIVNEDNNSYDYIKKEMKEDIKKEMEEDNRIIQHIMTKHKITHERDLSVGEQQEKRIRAAMRELKNIIYVKANKN